MDIRLLDINTDRKHNDRYLVVTDLGQISEAIGDTVNIIYTNNMDPGAIAGNHYHKEKRECFRVAEGEVLVYLEDVETRESQMVRLSSDPTDAEAFKMLVIPLGVAHAVVNVSEGVGKLDVYANHAPRIASDDFRYEVITRARADGDLLVFRRLHQLKKG